MSQKLSQILYSGVGALLIQDNKILLLYRSPNIFGGGVYCLPGGHIDGNEPVTHALARELNEEIGITINPEDAQFVHVCHRKSDDREYIDFLFLVRDWQGKPINKEPEKHEKIEWFSLDQLPENLSFFAAGGLKAFHEKIYYSEHGW